ncbi:hypothetical protein C1645_835489 [Glomus cerebriforme]|uniref:Uncharacterized protein n=1 Tax=Glomus cerebriforme TaxID=658196 RepID=A0A397S8T2_9GLOM|nr:hypothetical protein C1645_835489 [Glomus cerebriforme]
MFLNTIPVQVSPRSLFANDPVSTRMIDLQMKFSKEKSNLAQLESAYQTNKKKWTADQAFGNDYFNYLYGIMLTGTEWHFIMYTPNDIYSMSSSEYQINLMKFTIKKNPDLLQSNVKRVIGIIVGLLKDHVSIDSYSASKRVRIKKYIKK